MSTLRIATLGVLLCIGSGACADQAASQPAREPASSPASQPGDTVLIRIGDDGAVTQQLFEDAMKYGQPERFDLEKTAKLLDLINSELFLLYIRDHNLVSPSELEAETRRTLKDGGVATVEELGAILKQRGQSLEGYRRYKTTQIGLAKLIRQADKDAADEAKRKEWWDAQPSTFDGTRVSARHIAFAVSPCDPPEQWAAARAKAERMLADLRAGRFDWSEGVRQSADETTKRRDGSLGSFLRHGDVVDALADAAFKMAAGEMAVVETASAVHILEVTSRTPGARQYNYPGFANDVRNWREGAVYRAALAEARKKYKVVGVRPPTRFKYPPPPPRMTRPAGLPMTMPARPQGSSRPSPATRPGAPRVRAAQTSPAPPKR